MTKSALDHLSDGMYQVAEGKSWLAANDPVLALDSFRRAEGHYQHALKACHNGLQRFIVRRYIKSVNIRIKKLTKR